MGEPNVDKMLRQMPGSLFVEWLAYDRLDPIGEARADARAAIIAAAADNAGRGVVGTLAGKRLRPAKVKDYLLEYGKRQKAETPTDIYRAFKFALTLGGHLRKRDD